MNQAEWEKLSGMADQGDLSGVKDFIEQYKQNNKRPRFTQEQAFEQNVNESCEQFLQNTKEE
jgi:hypothetical protein